MGLRVTSVKLFLKGGDSKCVSRKEVKFMGMGGGRYCDCGCLPLRRFFSSKEEQEWLENYRDQLKKEMEGAEERIKELKRK